MFEDIDLTPPPFSVGELLDDPNGAAAYLAGMSPSAATAEAISLLDPATLSHAGRVDLLVAVERQVSWLAAIQAQVLAAMVSRTIGPDDRQWMREEVACVLRVSSPTAQERMADAAQLVDNLPGTRTCLYNGEISTRQADIAAQHSHQLDADQAAALEQQVLARAPSQSVANFARSVRRAVQRINPQRAEEKLADAMTERRVCANPYVDGMSQFWALLPAEGCAALMAALTAMASVKTTGDERTADQRRADALVELALRGLNDPTLPAELRMRPTVQVTVAMSTLLGLDDQPGELAGHGPIPASLARRIAADQSGSWRRLITDPVSGALLDYGTTTYRPPKQLADFVIARDQECAFPTCHRPARRCDLDHRHQASEGGATNPANLQPLCRRHHIAKDEAGWRVTRDHHGVYIWTSPTGHVYRNRPPDLPEDFGWPAPEPVRPPDQSDDASPPF